MGRPKGAPRALYRFEPEYSVQIAAVVDRSDLADVAHAKQLTHDTAIAHAGRRRRSGVTWTFVDHGDPALEEFLQGIEEAEGRRLVEVRRIMQIRTAQLVVAWVEVWPSAPADN